MGTTALDLYRVGNASSARLNQPRHNVDVTVFSRAGVEWVSAGSSGVSTFDSKDPTVTGIWWRLPAGSDYDDSLLYVWNDMANHWSWEPAKDMG